MVIQRGWKSADAVAAAKEFFGMNRRAAIRELIRELCSEDPFDRRCAAELARRVSIREPGILSAYADLLAEAAASFPIEEWQARGYVLIAAAQNATTRARRIRLLPLVRARLVEERIAVRAMAIEAFAILASHEPELRDEALATLEMARRSAVPALRSRARRMLPLIL
jgi:hypothetical protein